MLGKRQFALIFTQDKAGRLIKADMPKVMLL